jgi:methylamine--corrinoid protein Co-methyltransferase
MVTFLDVMEKALTGKPCPERDYTLKIFAAKLREIVKEYDIKYDPANPIISDDSLADDIFKAGFRFFIEVGAYCKDTERIIKFEEDELKEGLRNAPSKVVFGEGPDARTLIPRKPDDKTPPWCFLGAGGGPVSSEEAFMGLVEGYASIPEVNSITTPALTSVSGLRIRPKSPLEALGAIRNAVLAREATRRVGRPGLPIMNTLATAESAISLAIALHPKYGLRATDGYMIAIMDPMIVDFDRLNKVCAALSLNAPIGACFDPLMGGYSGGPEGTAVANVAHHFLSTLVYRSSWHLPFPLHIKYVCSSTPEMLWVISSSGQAISKNTHLLSLNLNYTAAGPQTEMCLYETAASVMAAVVSGLSIEALGVATNKYEDNMTPMEPKFSAEVARAVAGMKRSEANEIARNLLASYMDKIGDAPLGKKFQECFDIKRGKPSGRYVEVYNKVKKEIQGLGVKFEH